ALDLATRRSWTVLEKADPHLPAGRGYVYFPMLSNDNSLLAVGASPGEHDHFRADYDIFVLELDPATLLPRSPAKAIAPNPAIDRFPDPFRPAGATPGASGTPPSTMPLSRPAADATATARGLVFLWQRADAENRLSPSGASEVLTAEGLAWIDRYRAMALGGGRFSADSNSGRRLVDGLVAKHQMTLSLVLTPASLQQRGVIVASSDGPRAGNFILRQEGDRILLDLRTSDSPKEGTTTEVARLRSTAPVHLLLTFSPGRLEAFVDGAKSGGSERPIPVAGDFFPWKPRALTFGGAEGQSERWRGTLSEVAIWARPLAAAEIAGESARLRKLVDSRPAAERIVVDVRLRASSPTPTLDQISPYREALVVDEVEVVRQHAGPAVGVPRLRVVRWGILDRQTVPAAANGVTYRLVLEPFSAQPQLEPFFLADRLPASTGLPIFFDLGASATEDPGRPILRR
ncbi:MAG: LamG-like jellyroll fold domain-containing protein, partial [Thermoanaerobaculia bacterium]